MLHGRIKSFSLGLAVATAMVASQAQADSLNVMAIGDSLTNGYVNGGTPATTGWIEPLRDGDLNNAVGALNTFSFVGTQGSGDYMHEGHNGFYISQDAQDIKGGTTGNITSSLSVNGGTINPDSPVDVNIVMLLIGTNGSRSGANGEAAVEDLGELIDTLMASYLTSPTDKLLVSTLAPVAFQRKRFDAGLHPTDPENAGIDEFNQNLLDVFTGTSLGAGDGDWDAGYTSGTIAEHQDYSDQVYLLDLNSAFGATPDESLFQSDYLHFSTLGNELVADFYTDRYYELGIQQVPSPTSAATLLVMMGVGLTRRGRRAA